MRLSAGCRRGGCILLMRERTAEGLRRRARAGVRSIAPAGAHGHFLPGKPLPAEGGQTAACNFALRAAHGL